MTDWKMHLGPQCPHFTNHVEDARGPLQRLQMLATRASDGCWRVVTITPQSESSHDDARDLAARLLEASAAARSFERLLNEA